MHIANAIADDAERYGPELSTMLDSFAGKFEQGFKLKLMLGVLSITYKLTLPV